MLGFSSWIQDLVTYYYTLLPLFPDSVGRQPAVKHDAKLFQCRLPVSNAGNMLVSGYGWLKQIFRGAVLRT